eukprot:768259-Hanusia_phi.AAC.6
MSVFGGRGRVQVKSGHGVEHNFVYEGSLSRGVGYKVIDPIRPWLLTGGVGGPLAGGGHTSDSKIFAPQEGWCRHFEKPKFSTKWGWVVQQGGDVGWGENVISVNFWGRVLVRYSPGRASELGAAYWVESLSAGELREVQRFKVLTLILKLQTIKSARSCEKRRRVMVSVVAEGRRGGETAMAETRRLSSRTSLLPHHTRRAPLLSRPSLSLSASLSSLQALAKPLIPTRRLAKVPYVRRVALATAVLGLACVVLLPRGKTVELLARRDGNGLASSFVKRVYEEDKKAGEKLLQANKDKLHISGLDDILRDPSMKEYLSVALGSKKFQLDVPAQELKQQTPRGLAAARTPLPSQGKSQTGAAQQSKAKNLAENTKSALPVASASSFYAGPVKSNAGLNVVYDQFAPGILHGTGKQHIRSIQKHRHVVAHAASKKNPLSADDSHLFDDNFQTSTSKVGKLSQQIEELKKEIKEEKERNKELSIKAQSSHADKARASQPESPAPANMQSKESKNSAKSDDKESVYDRMLSDEMNKASRFEKENESHANFILNGGHYVTDEHQKNMLAATKHRSSQRSQDWHKLARISKELARKEEELKKAQESRDHTVESRRAHYVSKARDDTAPFLCGLPLLSELSPSNCRTVDHVEIASRQNGILEGLKVRLVCTCSSLLTRCFPQKIGLGDDEIEVPSGQVRGGAAGIPKRRFGKLWTPTHPYDKQSAVEALGYSDPQQYERHALLNTIAKEEDTIHSLKAELERRTGGVALHRHAQASNGLPVYHQLSDSYSSVGRAHSKHANLALEVMKEALKSDLS